MLILVNFSIFNSVNISISYNLDTTKASHYSISAPISKLHFAIPLFDFLVSFIFITGLLHGSKEHTE